MSVDPRTLQDLGETSMSQAKTLFLLFAASIACATAQQQGPEKPFVLANDKLELTISPNGARLERVMIKDGPPLSPLATMGHFLALDGFGTPSDQEVAAGMPFHGEANHEVFRILGHRFGVFAFRDDAGHATPGAGDSHQENRDH